MKKLTARFSFLPLLLLMLLPWINAQDCGHSHSSNTTDLIQLSTQFSAKTFPVALALAELARRAHAAGGHAQIVGGIDVNDPTGGLLCWQVSIQLKGLLGHVRCGGSIIGPRTILTAGHCVTTNRGSAIIAASMFQVMTGALDSAFDGTPSIHGVPGCGRGYSVVKVVRHPDFQLTFLNNDVALLLLAEDIDLTATCTCALCLTSKVPAVGEWCINMGYGQESESGIGDRNPVPLKMIYQQILQNVVSPLCRYTSGVQSSNFLCAGGIVGTDNCYGDSGGPLVCYDTASSTYYQSGIVSYAEGTCGDGLGSRYTIVSKYLDWISSNSQGN